MKAFDKFCSVLSKVIGAVAAVFLVIIIVTCAVQVFTRYVMGHALSWSEEAARYSFAWCMMLATVSCCYRRTHSGVTLLNDLLKGKAKNVHQALIDFAFLMFGWLMLRYGIHLSINQSKVISPLLHVPMWAVYGAIPAGGLGVMIMCLNNVLKDLFGPYDTEGKEA